MSTVKAKNVQVGTDTTAANNVVWAVPATQDGTARLQRGNAGATTADIIGVDANNFVTIPKLNTPFWKGQAQDAAAGTYSNSTLTLTMEAANMMTTGTNRVTPQRTGWYFVSANHLVAATSAIYYAIRKNGSTEKHAYYVGQAGNVPTDMNINTIVYFNGTTDYVDFYIQGTFTQLWTGPHSSISLFYVCG